MGRTREPAGHIESALVKRPLVPLLVTLAAAGATSAMALPAQAGLVVEEVEPGYVSALSGVRVGDVWLSWREEGGQKREGVFVSPLGIPIVEADVLSRGPVTVTARRGTSITRLISIIER